MPTPVPQFIVRLADGKYLFDPARIPTYAGSDDWCSFQRAATKFTDPARARAAAQSRPGAAVLPYNPKA